MRTFGPSMIVVSFLVLGCTDDSKEQQIGQEGAAGAEETGESGESSTGPSVEGMRTHLDFARLYHLADVSREGLFIDFGTPADAKYISGGWSASGWGKAGEQDGTTYRNAGKRGRVYFHVDEPSDLTVRLRLRAVGTQALTPYINNEQIDSVHFAEDSGWKSYDFTLPAKHVVKGENYLLLTFGGATTIDGEEVSVSVASARIGKKLGSGEYEEPTYGSLGIEGGLALPPNTAIEFFVQVPKQAKVAMKVVPGKANGQGSAKENAAKEGSARKEGEAPGTPEVILAVTGEDGATRELGRHKGSGDFSADLNPYAGQFTRVSITTADAPANIMAPRLVVPKGEDPKIEKPAKNVVVLLIDTLRADRLKPYNPKSRVKTPVLAQVAEEGTLFERAQSPENWTKPSVASILTSLYPMTHGTKKSESKLPEAALTLAEHYKANGFGTATFLANGYVSDKFGFDQGWDYYTNYIRENRSTEAENVFKEAADWIEKNKDERFFVYIQTIDPHVPYDPPDEYLEMYDDREYTGQVKNRSTGILLEEAKRNPPAVVFDASDRRRLEGLYDAEISYHDHHLGVFIERMKKMGLWENTAFVITSDHGEEFNDHGSWGHGHSVYQELLHVPLIFRYPGTVPKERVSTVVSTMDIAPTILELSGVPNLPRAEGRSLVGFMRGAPPPGPRVAFSDFLDDRRVLTTDRFKLILRGNLTASVFDLERDPREMKELEMDDRPLPTRYMRILLGQFLGAQNRMSWLDAKQSRGESLTSEDAEMDSTTREQLRALGYAN